MALSEEYKKALADNNQAIKVYQEVLAGYRAGTVDDETFLKARKEFDEAGKAFDAAHAKEGGY